MMRRAVLLVEFVALVLVPVGESQQPQRVGFALPCPPGKRYDAWEFPPRCIDCASIVRNRVNLTLVATSSTLVPGQQRDAIKFSPGLPQNKTCGCWSLKQPVVVDVRLNASYLVAGLHFPLTSAVLWLVEFDVDVVVAANGTTTVPWGTHAPVNHTAAATVLFPFPVRASALRLTIRRYAQHAGGGNASGGGVNLTVRAVVSSRQPFSCACPTLPNGHCCPFLNMSVRNGHCEWCKDPRDLNVVLDDQCGVCRPGTMELGTRCIGRPRPSTAPSLDVGVVETDGAGALRVQLAMTALPAASVYLIARSRRPPHHPCEADRTSACLFSPEYGAAEYMALTLAESDHGRLQFDRGRNCWFVTTSAQILSWADCTTAASFCRGFVGAVFSVGGGLVRVVEREVAFGLPVLVPSLVVAVAAPRRVVVPRSVEIHHREGRYSLWVPGLPRGLGAVRFQCAAIATDWVTTVASDEGGEGGVMTRIDLPDLAIIDARCARFRIAADNGRAAAVEFAVAQPRWSQVVRHSTVHAMEGSTVQAALTFGAGWGAAPGVGDTERLAVLTVRAAAPRVVAAASSAIMDATRDACGGGRQAALRWLQDRLALVADAGNAVLDGLVNRTCASAPQGRVFWVVPPCGGGDRRAQQGYSLRVEVVV
jgi:hypothetical protein